MKIFSFILYALMAMILSIAGDYIGFAQAEDLGGEGAFVQYVAPVVVITLIGIALLTQIQGIASQLAGGMSLSTQAGLAWAGRTFQRSASRATQKGLSSGGKMIGSGTAKAVRAPINFGKGYAAARSTAPRLPGPGYTPTPLDKARIGIGRLARDLRGRAGAARARAGQIRSDGVAYSAGAGTRRQAATLRAATKRRLSGG